MIPFIQSLKELKRFEKLLIDLKEKKDGSTEKIDLLLDKIEKKANSSKNDFFLIEKLFFTGFDELINKIIVLGNIKKDFLDKLPEYYKDRYIFLKI